MRNDTVRTTLALPRDLLAKADEIVRQGDARSRNELVADALRRELRKRETEQIDAQIRLMAFDEEYKREAEQIMKEFEESDWESIKDEPPYEDGEK